MSTKVWLALSSTLLLGAMGLLAGCGRSHAAGAPSSAAEVAPEITAAQVIARPLHHWQELTGTLQALTFLNQAWRADLKRVLVLRTVSNYDREAPGSTPAESLKSMVDGKYAAYMPALEAAEIVGDKVVRDLVAHWAERESIIPGSH